MKNILVPIDFSPVTRAVLQEARKLAELLPARIVLVHIVKQPLLVPDYPGMIADYAEILDSATRTAQQHLTKWCRQLTQTGLAAEEKIVIGIPGIEILRLAKKLHPQYIVIGSHGHSAFYEFVVGGTTRGVLRDAGCPVVVIASPPPKRY